MYPLRETGSLDYGERTLANVCDSDATLVLVWGQLSGGTAYTVECARQLNKPAFILNSPCASDIAKTLDWIERNTIGVLNVAGPRESTNPGAYRSAYAFMSSMIDELRKRG